jgi:hypothetical protein
VKAVTDRDDVEPPPWLMPALEQRARAPALDDEAPVRGAAWRGDAEVAVGQAGESLVLPPELLPWEVRGLEDDVADPPGRALTAAEPGGPSRGPERGTDGNPGRL